MPITDLLAQTGGLDSIARELGISDQDAARGAEALVPAILGGFKRQAQAQPIDQVLAPEPTDVRRGDDVLGQIFGSRDVSRNVARGASSQSGLDPALLKKMLPMLAMLVAGYMAKQQGGGRGADTGYAPRPTPSGGGLGDLLGSVLGGGRAASPGAASGGGGLASMLDLDGDGNPLDDILEMASRALR
jgi:hypothetical protein